MKLDINEVYHQYIIKVVIFSLFTFKRLLRQPEVYKQSVYAFTKKRLPWVINLRIDTGERGSRESEREILLNELLDGIESSDLATIVITFSTPLKDMTMEINLKDVDRYESYLYS